MKLILFVGLAAFWFLFIKLNLSWFFLREICCILIYYFVKLNLSRYFSSWNLLHVSFFVFVKHYADFCSWNLLHVYYFFKKLNVCWSVSSRNISFLFSWKLLYVDFSLRETCTGIFILVKRILFVELLARWFLFRET